MSVTRQLNVISQMRLDVPHIRLIESGVAGDFDTVVGRGFAGSNGLILRGFTIAGSAGSAANTLQLVTADGIAINLNASESGSFLWVPASRASELLDGATNGRIEGAFVPSAVNYVGIDFVRELDDSTIDLVKFKDPVTEAESDRLVPLGNVLNYKIIISTSPFSTMANVIPVAKVTVSSTGAATTITDARQLMFRLGSGGDVPDAQSSYSWPAGRVAGAFTGADKSFASQKEWTDSIMTRLWELGGGENWFSATADRNVHMTNYGSPFSNGDYMTFNSGTGAISWQGIRFLIAGSTATINEVAAGSGTIADGECLYVDLDRTQDRLDPGDPLVASIVALANLGAGTVPGSRWVLAWRVGTSLFMRDWRYPVGTTFTPATTTAMGVVKLNQTPETPLTPVVVSIMAGGGIVVGATSGNTNGGNFSGFGTASGVVASGGASGRGVYAQGGTNNQGVYGLGDGTAAGVAGQGGATAGAGVQGTGGAGGAGGSFTGGAATGPGVVGAGTGTGAGVQGTGGAGGVSVGVRAIAGATTNSIGVHATAADGFGIVASAVIGIGGALSGTTYGAYVEGTGLAAVRGIGTGTAVGGDFSSTVAEGLTASSTVADGIIGTGGTNKAGVIGNGTGGGSGVEGTGGVTSGYGVKGQAGAGGVGVIGLSDTVGVYGQSTAGANAGVSGSALGTGPGVQGAAASISGAGVKSTVGNVEAPVASRFAFSAAKTGFHFLSVAELSEAGGPSSAPLGTGGTLGLPHYTVTNVVGTAIRLVGTVHLPRGATITKVLIHVANGDVATTYNINQPLIDIYTYGAADHDVMTKTSVVAAATVNVAVSGTQSTTTPGYWIPCAVSAVAAPSASTVIANSGACQIDWTINTHTSSGADIAGLMIEYTYTTVDFGL